MSAHLQPNDHTAALREIAGAVARLKSTTPAHLEHAVLTSACGTSIDCFVFRGPAAAHDPIRIGVFAAIHGDEPASALAALRLLDMLIADVSLGEGYHLYVYPVTNPSGLEAGTRANARGSDLNREFWKASAHAEVRLLENELSTHRFHGLVSLHADDTCEGLYGYAHGRLLNEELLKPALEASEQHLPRDRRPLIDGFAAAEGIIHYCYQGVLSAPPDQKPAPFDIILETPALAPIDLQAAAALDGLLAILRAYRRFISYGGDL